MRYLTVSRVIGATALLMRFRRCRNDADDMAVMARAKCILNGIWTVQYHSDSSPGACEDFWLRTRRFVEEHEFVASFRAICDETVNPPGTVGRVSLSFKVDNTVEVFTLKLELLS